MWVDFDMSDNSRWSFLLEEASLWTHILARYDSLKVKTFVSDKHAAFGFTKYQFTAEDPLVNHA